jgi:lipopolysaccharide export system protein LptA
MMLKLHFRNSLSFFTGSLLVFFLVTAGIVSAESDVKRIKGPIVITSEKLTAENAAHTALFERSVVARTKEMTIYADKMLVYSDKDTGDVTRIDASGSVQLIKGNRVVTSQEAVYVADGDKAVFTGEPKALEDGNIITGKKMTYLLGEDRFFVEGSRVFLTKKESP